MRRHGNIDKRKTLKGWDLVRYFGSRISDPSMHRLAKLGFSQEKDYYRKLLKQYDYVNQGKVIDLGCGYGRWAVFLAEVNKHVIGVDHKPQLIEIASKLADYFEFDNLDFQVGTITQLPFPDSSFDAGWLHGVLFPVNRAEILSEAARVIRPGGRLFVGALNGPGKVLERLCQGYMSGGIEDPVFKRALQAFEGGPFSEGPNNYGTREKLELIMGQYGFAVEGQYPVKDFKQGRLSADEAAMLNNPKGLCERFTADGEFRGYVLDNYKRLMLGVDFDLWFSARATKV